MSKESIEQMVATTMAFAQKIAKARPYSPSTGTRFDPPVVSDGDVIAGAVLTAAFGTWLTAPQSHSEHTP